ncbi:MAG TPA: hypothetical protein VM889_09100 [Candidatus Thermoplasmatota archaeon]|nr:hypothetical protein [Candidatus Thermoplasmatota archaeon]
MDHACACGEPAHYIHESRKDAGLCRDCYRSMSAEERRAWVARKSGRFAFLRSFRPSEPRP